MPASSIVAPIEEFPADKWDAILAINLSARVPHHPRSRCPAMKQKQVGPHHQHRLGARAGRLALQVGLCRRQARHRRPDQDRGARSRRATASPSTRSAPAMSGRRWSQKQIPDTAKARGITRRAGDQRRAARRPADQALRHGRGGGARWRVLSPADSAGIDHRHRSLPIDGGWTAH